MGGSTNHFATYPITEKTTATNHSTDQPNRSATTLPLQHVCIQLSFHLLNSTPRHATPLHSTLNWSLQLMNFLLHEATDTDTDTDTDTVIDAQHCMRQWNAPLKIHCYYYYRCNFSSCTTLISSSSVRDKDKYQWMLRAFAAMECVKSIKSLHCIGTAHTMHRLWLKFSIHLHHLHHLHHHHSLHLHSAQCTVHTDILLDRFVRLTFNAKQQRRRTQLSA